MAENKSIFEFADKFGYESPFGDWIAEEKQKREERKRVDEERAKRYPNDKRIGIELQGVTKDQADNFFHRLVAVFNASDLEMSEKETAIIGKKEKIKIYTITEDNTKKQTYKDFVEAKRLITSSLHFTIKKAMTIGVICKNNDSMSPGDFEHYEFLKDKTQHVNFTDLLDNTDDYQFGYVVFHFLNEYCISKEKYIENKVGLPYEPAHKFAKRLDIDYFILMLKLPTNNLNYLYTLISKPISYDAYTTDIPMDYGHTGINHYIKDDKDNNHYIVSIIRSKEGGKWAIIGAFFDFLDKKNDFTTIDKTLGAATTENTIVVEGPPPTEPEPSDDDVVPLPAPTQEQIVAWFTERYNYCFDLKNKKTLKWK